MSIQILKKVWHLEPAKSLVESKPIQEGTKLSITENTPSLSWEDLRGLSWIWMEKDSERFMPI